eukprot:COSAG01_NODE_25209_length_752_cov_1.088821_1_plen_72_part_10
MAQEQHTIFGTWELALNSAEEALQSVGLGPVNHQLIASIEQHPVECAVALHAVCCGEMPGKAQGSSNRLDDE